MVEHDRIHAREPAHSPERWRRGRIEDVTERDGHCVVTVDPDDGDPVELRVTLAVRDLFVDRLDLADGETPVGSRIWFRRKGRG